ncbi:MAG: NAD(P)/FAD-dependent oxidoreductase [Alphaproteobacteria bacterium]
MQTGNTIAIIGGGPAGLMAAEVLAQSGQTVTVFERKPSVARKFLMAGRGGLNLTHSEDIESFLKRYGGAGEFLAPAIRAFPPRALRDWCEGLGEETFIGSSGRVFPKGFKASPLLRAWQSRLVKLGIRFMLSHEWRGWDDGGHLMFRTSEGDVDVVKPGATLLALGGASWPRLGSDGGWVDILKKKGVDVATLAPSNCGFAVAWTEVFRQKFAGQPLKSMAMSFQGQTVAGEAMITDKGIEGGVIYALSPALREEIAAKGAATLMLDLRPGVTEQELARRLDIPRQAKSFSNFLRVSGGLSPVAIGLLREAAQDAPALPAAKLARLIKALPLCLDAPFGIERAISSAGGIMLDELDEYFMLKKLPGVFAAGEMLDWEAPTGGYLLQASFSTAMQAARGINRFISGTTE